MSKFDQFKAKLRPGQTYRRADLAQWSTAVDRHLKEAVQAGVLTCAEQRPRRTRCLSPSPQLAYYWPGRKACMLRRSTRCH